MGRCRSMLLRLLNIRSLVLSVYFNFKYLPFKQAVKLPISLHKPELVSCKGTIEIQCSKIKRGMISIGKRNVSLYPNSGVTWENKGGKVIFKGECHIGSESSISVGSSALLTFGSNFRATAKLKLACYNKIIFGKNMRIAWEVIMMDTSFHKLKDCIGNVKGSTIGEIIIGDNNWLPTRCMVMKGTKTPDFCIFGAGSFLNKDYTKNPTHILMAGNPLEVKATNIWRDVSDDAIE